jgi:Ca2+:H+ antiporter
VVQVSLLGSIISNTLLVLGMACIAGGLKKPVQKFNATAASANTTLLLMAVRAVS